jgi:hypothetical protein
VTRWHLAFAVLCVFCTGAIAQQNAPVTPPTTHQHLTPDTAMIDGKDHPEQIPDLTAYRLYLLAISRPAAPTAAEQQSQAIHLKMAHLSDKDTQALIPILASFHESYMKLIEEFNKQAEAENAKGQYLDPSQLIRDRDTLVQSIHDTLKSVLSPNGWSRIDTHIQRQKRMMKIPAAEGQQ